MAEDAKVEAEPKGATHSVGFRPEDSEGNSFRKT